MRQVAILIRRPVSLLWAGLCRRPGIVVVGSGLGLAVGGQRHW